MDLDKEIGAALASLKAPRRAVAESDAYIGAFRESAKGRAREVLEALSTSTFASLTPVFVSIGGGDGTELAYLLENSTARHWILIE